jgi:hypothetical protein
MRMRSSTDGTMYNGWTNYETWRVNLECLSDDPYYSGHFFDDNGIEWSDDLDVMEVALLMAEYMEGSVNDFVELELNRPDGLVVGWLRAFLSDVNWYEIAKHRVEDWVTDQRQSHE